MRLGGVTAVCEDIGVREARTEFFFARPTQRVYIKSPDLGLPAAFGVPLLIRGREASSIVEAENITTGMIIIEIN